MLSTAVAQACDIACFFGMVNSHPPLALSNVLWPVAVERHDGTATDSMHDLTLDNDATAHCVLAALQVSVADAPFVSNVGFNPADATDPHFRSLARAPPEPRPKRST
jgi:hypothetical protein